MIELAQQVRIAAPLARLHDALPRLGLIFGRLHLGVCTEMLRQCSSECGKLHIRNVNYLAWKSSERMRPNENKMSDRANYERLS